MKPDSLTPSGLITKCSPEFAAHLRELLASIPPPSYYRKPIAAITVDEGLLYDFTPRLFLKSVPPIISEVL
jgi:hypothetical protein